MKILAIDCSAKSVSAAIGEDGRLISEGFLNISLTHSETLMPLISQVMENARLTLKDIDGFAISAGPGSFTGIRIGISALKGMAFAEEKPVYSFSTPEAMALVISELHAFNGIICPLMDARRDQFYNALFSIKEGKIIRLTEDRLISASNLDSELKENYENEKIIFMGDGAKLYTTLTENPNNIALAPESFRIQRASGMAIFASKNNCEKSPTHPKELMPIYLRPSQAERERSERLGK